MSAPVCPICGRPIDTDRDTVAAGRDGALRHLRCVRERRRTGEAA